jgi:hypothetical protein
VKKKKNKKKHAIKSSKNMFYHHELENILKNKELFWENKSNNVISSIDTEVSVILYVFVNNNKIVSIFTLILLF